MQGSEGTENGALKQVQELFFHRKLVVSSDPRSELKTTRSKYFLESHLKR